MAAGIQSPHMVAIRRSPADSAIRVRGCGDRGERVEDAVWPGAINVVALDG